MTERVDVLLPREVIARAFGDPRSVKGFEELQRIVSGAPDLIVQAQTTANTANTTANTADGKANALKNPQYYVAAATGTLNNEIVLDAAVITALLGYTPVEMVAAPTLSTDPGVAGQVAYDAGFFYVCVAVSTWKRVAIATF